VKDRNEQALAYAYFEDEPGRCTTANRLTPVKRGGLRPILRCCRRHSGGQRFDRNASSPAAMGGLLWVIYSAGVCNI